MRIKKFETINVIPFIDIMLVLLVIVLTTASFIAKGEIPLELPTAKSASNLPLKHIEITITKDGKVYLNKKEIKNLQKALQGVSKKSDILIRSDKNSRFEVFIDVLDTLKSEGFENIAVETQK